MPLTDSGCARIGAVIGLASWFGMGDLHRQNLAFGTLADGRPLCAPLDIECLLVDHQLPSQSRLIGYHDEAGRNCGLAGFQALLDEAGRPDVLIAAVLHGYIAAMTTLSGHEGAIAAALAAEHGIARWPIRVILRDTVEYRSILDGATRRDALRPPLLESESSQLERGDVPYYYREAASAEFRWLVKDSRDWADSSSAVPLDAAHFPSLGIMRTLGGDGRVGWRNRETLLGAGALQIARMLAGRGRGEAGFGAASVSITEERIAVSWGEGKGYRWACAR